MSRARWIGLTLAVAAIGAVVWVIFAWPTPSSRTYARPLPLPSPAAFTAGGVPLHEDAIDQLFVDRLTTLVVDAGRARDKGARDILPIVQPLLAPPELARVAGPWRAMMTTFAEAFTGADHRAADHLREAVREVSVAFADAGLGYFLEGRFKGGYPFLQAYRAEEVVLVVAAGKPRRVLSLRRLDHLNTSYALLGMQSEDIGDPVLLLDQIDSFAASTVFPLLAPAAPYPVAERGWLAGAEGKTLSLAIGEAARRELATALGDDAAVAEQAAKLIVERADLIEQWRDVLERKHMSMIRTDDLFLPDHLLANLEDLVPKYQRERAAAIEDRLAELEAPRLTTRLQGLVAATVRRHEAQHGFDEARDAELRYPAELAALLGPQHDAQGDEPAIVRSARAELSGYLSQVANDPVTPQLALANLSRQAFSRDRWGTGEAFAAIVVLEGLARELGATVEGTPFRRGIDRERLATYALLIAKQPGPALRAAAARLWLALYGEPLTKIVGG